MSEPHTVTAATVPPQVFQVGDMVKLARTTLGTTDDEDEVDLPPGTVGIVSQVRPVEGRQNTSQGAWLYDVDFTVFVNGEAANCWLIYDASDVGELLLVSGATG